MNSIISSAELVHSILNDYTTQIRVLAKGKNFKVDYVPETFNHVAGGNIGGFYFFEKNKKIKGWTTTENFYDAVDLNKLTALMKNQKDFPLNIGDEFCLKEPFFIEEETGNIFYKADDIWEEQKNYKWKSPLCMPSKYIRVFLKIINVRLEKLQDISYEDLKNQMAFRHFDDAIFRDSQYKEFRTQWDKRNKKGYKYEDNPIVFVYDFKIVKAENEEM